jgi:hypothetical protein
MKVTRGIVLGLMLTSVAVVKTGAADHAAGMTSASCIFVEQGMKIVATDSSQVNLLQGNTGGPAAMSEPATGLLLGAALVIAGLMRRGKKKPNDSTIWETLG